MGAKGVGIINGTADTFHHAVCFYESDEVLVQEIADFLDLTNPGAAVVVATRPHREALQAHLDRLTIDRMGGRLYMTFDAETLMDRILVDNFPDEIRFKKEMGRLLGSLGPGPVRIFGEIVALLWSRGDVPAALKLEKLWNELAEDHCFELFCAYPTSVLDTSAGLEAYLRMCNTHSQLVPFKG